jgi:hypothetical protein
MQQLLLQVRDRQKCGLFEMQVQMIYETLKPNARFLRFGRLVTGKWKTRQVLSPSHLSSQLFSTLPECFLLDSWFCLYH